LAKRQNYLGIGIDGALPAPRSAIQIVSPAGSTPVGVSSPSLSTVRFALSPCTVSRDFAAAILCEDELTARYAHAVWPFYRLVDPDIDRYSRFTRGIDRNAIKLVEDHVVHIEHAIEECNPIDAPERRMLQIKLRCRGARRQPKDSARDSIRNIESLIRSNFEIVADITVSWQVPADLRRASCEIEASQRGMPLGRSSVWYRR
jgi:hypothetical protein